jgi:chemotaxis-related protein WspB
MFALLLHAGADHFALDARRVLEVVPIVELRRLPHAPASIAGLATWRGRVIPVVDLVRLLTGRTCPERMSSRIVVVELATGTERARPLGLLAEGVTDVRRLDPGAMVDIGVAFAEAPYLGKVIRDGGALVQLVDVDALLPATLQKLLYSEAPP